MAITRLYHTCLREIQQLRPQERVTRARNMVWLMAGLFMGRCVHLSHMARKIPGKSQKLSKVQAQIFAGRTLVSTCVVDAGETRILPVNSVHYDIFFKNGATGWEIARKLESAANSFTLSQHKGRYTIHEAKEKDSTDLVTKSELAVKRSR